jgi:hypothetical protein
MEEISFGIVDVILAQGEFYAAILEADAALSRVMLRGQERQLQEMESAQ